MRDGAYEFYDENGHLDQQVAGRSTRAGVNAERASGVIASADDLGYVPGAFHGRLAQRGRFAVDLTAAGNAIGLVLGWRIG